MAGRRLALLVDDDAHIRQFICMVLEREGFEVLEASGGVAALKLVESRRGEFDIIITDLQMPEGDGLTFAGEVHERYSQIPILLVSGSPQPETPFSYLEKPFSSAALSLFIGKLTASERQERYQWS